MFTATRKRFSDNKEVEITLLPTVITGDDDKQVTIEYTDTTGARKLSGFSISNLSKLARNKSIASTQFGKGRLIDIASLKNYYDNERKQPSAATQANEAHRAFSAQVAKIVASKQSPSKKVAAIAKLTLALDSELTRLAKIAASKNKAE